MVSAHAYLVGLNQKVLAAVYTDLFENTYTSAFLPFGPLSIFSSVAHTKCDTNIKITICVLHTDTVH